jgi:hypothetical protein
VLDAREYTALKSLIWIAMSDDDYANKWLQAAQ